MASPTFTTPSADEPLVITPGRPIQHLPGANDPDQATKPRFLVKINGEVWPEIISATVETVGGIAINSNAVLYASYSAAANANEIGTMNSGSRLRRLVDPHVPKDPTARDTVEIHAGYSSKDEPLFEELPLIFSGFITRLLATIVDNAVAIYCVDFAIVFKESFTQQQFRGKTTSEAVREIGDRYSFDTTNVNQTSTPLGNVYDYERIHFEAAGPQGLNNWELINKFADTDGYKVFAIGKSLYYVPYGAFNDIIHFELGKNIERCELEKNFAVSSSRVSIEFLSTDVKKKENVVVQRGIPSSQAGAKGDLVQYRYVRPANTTIDELSLAAEALALMITQFEFVVLLTCTGLGVQSVLNRADLTATNSIFDQEYQISRVRWDLSVDSGWTAQLSLLRVPPGGLLRSHVLRQRRSIEKK